MLESVGPRPRQARYQRCATPDWMHLILAHFSRSQRSGVILKQLFHTFAPGFVYCQFKLSYLSKTKTSCDGVESFSPSSYPPEVIFPLTK